VTTVKLTWTDNAADEQYYSVERSPNGGAWSQAALLLAGSTAWTNYFLEGDTTYSYRVRAIAGSAQSGYSNTVSVTTEAAPAAPTNLHVTATTDSSVSLAWTDNAAYETHYRVERSTGGSAWSQVAILLANTTSWTNTSLAASTAYSYRVRASVDNLYSAYSDTLTVTTAAAPPPPAAPTNLVATPISAAEIRLTWQDNATDEQYYRIERSTDGTTFSEIGLTGANTTTWSNTNLAAETTYFYRVRATAGAGASAYSNTASATTGSAPNAPSNLSATALGADSIRITWQDNAADEQYYRVERSADGATFSQVALLLANTTAWTNYSLTPSTTYLYRVRGSAGSTYSAFSNTASATTSPPPAAPTNLGLTVLGPESIRLNWQDNATTEQFYRVERSGDGATFAQVALLGANATTWTNTGLLADSTYTYRVRAIAGSVYSGYSNSATATTSAPPASPTGLTLTVLGPDSIRVNWVDNAVDEQYHRIERSTDGLIFTQVALVVANVTTWTNYSLSPSTTYFYRVRASAGSVYSGYSNAAFATTAPPPAAPSNLAANILSTTSVKLTWSDNATSEQYYRIERSTDGSTFSQVAIVLANSTSWTNYSLTAGTTYWYRVRASVGSIYSDYSEIAQATPGGP
jgi:titin